MWRRGAPEHGAGAAQPFKNAAGVESKSLQTFSGLNVNARVS